MEFGFLPNTVALAVVAVLGYLFGRSALRAPTADPNQMRRELKRARLVVNELERIAQEVRRSIASHHSSVLHFKDRLSELGATPEQAATRDICREAEHLLRPTVRLATQMASAYDELRQQSTLLMSFTEVRTDPLTGLSNRRALNESISTFMAIQKRYRTPFTIGIVDIDHFKAVNDEFGHPHGDAVLKDVADSLERCVRETDIVARFGGEEFVVVMPETDLEGAAVLDRRIRRSVEAETDVTISCGMSQVLHSDDEHTLVARADKALYAAKADGRNCIFQHTGEDVQRLASTQLVAACEAEDENAELVSA